jgi:hypothetical protein
MPGEEMGGYSQQRGKVVPGDQLVRWQRAPRDPTSSRTIPWIVGMFDDKSFSGKGNPGGTERPLEDEQATPGRQLPARAD